MRYGMTILALVAVLALGVMVHAGQIVLREGGGTGIIDTPFDDTWLNTINDANPPLETDRNYGTDTTMRARAGNDFPGLYLRHSPLFGINNLFDELSSVGVTDSSWITSATLRIVRTNTNEKSFNLYRMLTDWMLVAAGTNEIEPTFNELDADDNLLWAHSNGTFSPTTRESGGSVGAPPVDFSLDNIVSVATLPSGTGAAGTGHDLDVTAQLIEMLDANVNAGWVIFGGGNGGPLTLAASEHATAAWRPTLTVEYIPEPGTMLLLGTGVLGLIGYMRRRKMR